MLYILKDSSVAAHLVPFLCSHINIINVETISFNTAL